MATIIQLPRLSDTMEEGVIAKWHVAVGDKIRRGQLLAEIETDKATMEFESFEGGTVLKLVAAEGEVLVLGAPIAVLGAPGEDPDQALSSAPQPSVGAAVSPGPAASAPLAPSAVPHVPASTEKQASSASVAMGATTGHLAATAGSKAEASSVVAAAEVQPSAAPQGRVPASPLARRMARERGIDLARVRGTGPRGRVVKADLDGAVHLAAEVPAAVAVLGGETDGVDADGRPLLRRPDTQVRLSQMRKAIARRMVQSKQEAPHFYLTASIDMESAAAFRAEINDATGAKVSFNDLIVLACAKALRRHPRVNARYEGDQTVQVGDVHVGVAVAIEDGLTVPVVRYADQKSVTAIAKETRSLGERAKERKLKPEEMTGSTFTVSNLGMFGIHAFAAVVNPGEGAILAVGAIEPTVVPRDGQIVVRRLMKVTLSCDHRVIDGAEGAAFLATVRGLLEKPVLMFA